jgi:glycosyltransferase 2 family protein
MTRGTRAARALRPALTAGSLAISAIFLYLAIRGVDLYAFRRAVRQSDWVWLIAAPAVLAVAVAIRVVRWRYLFDPATRPGARAATRALLVGELLNSVLPFRSGDVGRVLVLHRDTRLSNAEVGSTVVAERLLDTVVLLLLLFVSTPFLPQVTWLAAATALLAGAAAVVVVAVLVLSVFGDRPLAWALRRGGRILGLPHERMAETAARLARGARAFRELRAGALAFALSLATWLLVAASFWLVMRAMHLQVGFGAAILVTVATTFALVIPAAPTSVGVFEAAVLVSLRPYGVGDARALACAVVLHVLSFAPFILAGLAALRLHPGETSVIDAAKRTLPPHAPRNGSSTPTAAENEPDALRKEAAASRATP